MTIELKMVKRTLNKKGEWVPELDPDGRVKYHPTFSSEKGYDIWKEFESKSVKRKKKKTKKDGSGTGSN